MPRFSSLSFLSVLLLLVPAALRAQAPLPDPAALKKDIEALTLDTDRAVALKNVKLSAGLGVLQLSDGFLFPATPVGGKVVEMVFLGKGRITLEAPDAIEAGQLELFTGASRLDAEFGEAVLVVGLDAAVDAMLRKPAAQPDAATLDKAKALYQEWRKRREREILGVERSLLLDGLRDPSTEGYFAAWFRGAEQGDFLYTVEPASREQVTLGRFVPLDATEKEKRKILREIGREQRKGRLIGLELDDLGQWDTWLSASLRDGQGKPHPGSPAFEPTKYTLDLTVAPDLRLSGTARLDLEPAIAGSRAVMIRVPDLKVTRVTDPAGADLYYQTAASELTVVLPKPTAEGEIVPVVVHFESHPIEKDWNIYRLLDTQGWYPQTGEINRAAFDATFHWPRGLDLMAGGRRVDGGEQGNQRWERRVLESPALGYTFELGNFDVDTVKSGHVEIRFAFGSGSSMTGKGTRESVRKAVQDSLAYFEETFGPYPFDELTVVTADRGFSQSLPGFMTLSDFLLNDAGMWNKMFGLEDRRLVIAHEMAHQWWGDNVGWASYRDQWMSEALASYAALLYGRVRLKNELSGVDLTEGWFDAVTAPLPDGSPVESVGPVVLGWRLVSSRAADAYQPIVYMKGAVVVDMLARMVGEDTFPKVLQQIAKVAGGGMISTEDLFAMIGKVTSVDLQPFADQYVYGTGLPEVYYDFRFEKEGDGWVVKGTTRQRTPHRFRYKVVATDGGAFDVVRQAAGQVDVKTSALVVPVTVAVVDPKGGKKGLYGANAAVKGNLLLRGETADFSIPVPYEPKKFWLDKDHRVFGYFLSEERHPKWYLYLQGEKAAAAGNLDEAAAFYEKALTAKEPPPDDGRTVYYDNLKWQERMLNGRIELSRARFFLDRGDEARAEESLDKAQRAFGDRDDTVQVLRARLEIRRGDFEKAFRRLRKGVLGTEDLDTSEAYALLAVAAQKAGHAEELTKAIKKAKETGADVSALSETSGAGGS
ncbi:MAG TPA: M1 family aminopeptidase [Thermoanaerobaculia bacterium]|nr:M1 family aminopeptidase [Thermoanaerobaculia bacterium]